MQGIMNTKLFSEVKHEYVVELRLHMRMIDLINMACILHKYAKDRGEKIIRAYVDEMEYLIEKEVENMKP